jgi:hypothetical protein
VVVPRLTVTAFEIAPENAVTVAELVQKRQAVEAWPWRWS